MQNNEIPIDMIPNSEAMKNFLLKDFFEIKLPEKICFKRLKSYNRKTIIENIFRLTDNLKN